MRSKPSLVPVYFDPGRDEDFERQLDVLKELLSDDAEFLAPVPLGANLPESDAVLFPQLLGEAYHKVNAFRAFERPILIVTSQFGTLSMWDWEIVTYLQGEGVSTIAPYTLSQTTNVCRALAVKRRLQSMKLLVYQDDPGEGFQASIFKRFYWWENECTERMRAHFGVSLDKRSFRELGERAKSIPDERADEAWRGRDLQVDLSPRALRSALKLYLAVKDDIDSDDAVGAAGINCLNESHFSDTTPCLAWNLLYEDQGMIWGCEADTVSMLTKYILNKSLNVPIMMTNMYPFLLGQAALHHERISHFPDVEGDPDNYVLAAHCGYLGVLPKAFSTEWTLRSKVLEIVDDNASAIDARLPTGEMTLAKLHPTMTTLSVAEGQIEGYAQYPDSDCLNGAVLKVNDGREMMKKLSSHHYLLMTGHLLADIEMIAPVFDLNVDLV